MVSLQVWDERNNVWATGELYDMVSDQDEVADLCDEAGIDITHIDKEAYTILVWADTPSGSKLRYVINE